MAILDTNVVIEILRGNPKLTKFIDELQQHDQFAVTTITQYELLKHLDAERRKDAREFISNVDVYSFDTEGAEAASSTYLKLKASGKLVNENDILIAGIAKAKDELLVTTDRDFEKIEGLKLVVI